MVTIIIVNENTKDALELCLLSIKKYTTYSYRVIVVDHSSSDGSLDLLNKKFPWVKVIEISDLKTTERHGKALNIGVQNVKSKYFLTLDTDVEILDYNWLTEMVKKTKKARGVFCGEISPAKNYALWGDFSERCLPHCLLVDTCFFRKHKCSFIPELVANGFPYRYQRDTGSDVWLKTKKNNLSYCLLDKHISNKFIHYGNITVATLYQTNEWHSWCKDYLKIYSRCSNLNIGEYNANFDNSIKIKNKKIDLIKKRIKLLESNSIENETHDLNKTYTDIHNTLKELSIKLFSLGESYFISKNHELSTEKFKEASFFADTDFKNHILTRLALVYSIRKMPEESKKVLSNLLISYPDNIELLYANGSVYKFNNEFAKAINFYRRVIEMETKCKDKFWAGAYFHLGEIYLKSGKTSLATENFKSCLKFNPGHKSAIYHIESLDINHE